MDWITFYGRWGLETMATNELAIPLRPSLHQPALYDQRYVSGLRIDVPFYLLRDRQIDLHAVAAEHLSSSENEHLREWFFRTEQKNWGYDRYSYMLRHAIFIESALRQRYSERLHGNVERVDSAVAKYFFGKSGSSETVKRVRHELAHRLGR